MKSVGFKLFIYLFDIIRIVIMLFIFLLVVSFFTQYVDRPNQYPTLVKINQFEQSLSAPITNQIKLAMPYKYQGTDFSPVILIVIMLILAHLCYTIKDHLVRAKQRTRERKNYYDWRKKASGVLSKEKMTEMDNKFAALNTVKAKGTDRKRILKEFAMLKSQLDSMGQQLAFLAIDVVDSTGMKRDEDKYLAAYDFDTYNQLVSESLKQHGVIKYAMTPDGIMSCFRTVDDAVLAAKSILQKLKHFNAHDRKIKQGFAIRCGINAGYVYMDDETPLEQISDRVIDIAGHMQKYAKPNCINIAASAIEPLKSRSGFDETPDVIDEQKVFQYTEDDLDIDSEHP
ncbi:MAG: hypothetical protein H0U70_04500 [Tatlockia sp.]|nr:hypothetical protein [Tatlockia sp.]